MFLAPIAPCGNRDLYSIKMQMCPWIGIYIYSHQTFKVEKGQFIFDFLYFDMGNPKETVKSGIWLNCSEGHFQGQKGMIFTNFDTIFYGNKSPKWCIL